MIQKTSGRTGGFNHEEEKKNRLQNVSRGTSRSTPAA